MTEPPAVLPEDAHNRTLLSHVGPPDWVNPDPAGRYNLVVIGAGTAGLISAVGAAGLRAKTALIEKHLMGGDCLNVGCIPSKALLRAAHAYADVHDAGDFGVRVPPGARVDFPAVMERMRRLRARISLNDSASRFRGLGVDVFLGEGRFTGRDTVEVGGRRLRFRKTVMATGARAAAPPIAGIEEAGYLTNETVFSLTELPRRLAVIGAGPIGCELSQAFARFGSQVLLIEKMGQILIREDRDAAKRVGKSLLRNSVKLIVDCNLLEIRKENGEKILRFDCGGDPGERNPGGRRTGTQRPGPRPGGDQRRVRRKKRRPGERPTNRRIYAAGDICFPHQFTHTADATARIVIQNALFLGRARANALTIPWCTYTDPEIAHVGLYEGDAVKRGIPVQTFSPWSLRTWTGPSSTARNRVF